MGEPIIDVQPAAHRPAYVVLRAYTSPVDSIWGKAPGPLAPRWSSRATAIYPNWSVLLRNETHVPAFHQELRVRGLGDKS